MGYPASTGAVAGKSRQDSAGFAVCCRDLNFAFSCGSKLSSHAVVRLSSMLAVGLGILATRGVAEEVPVPKSSNGGDWCLGIPADVGVLVDNPDAIFVQKLQLGGHPCGGSLEA